jgi:hypothetical protein
MKLGNLQKMRYAWLFTTMLNMTGCSAAWLARLTGGQKVGGSNPLIPIFQSPTTPAIAGAVGNYGLINPVLSSWMASD